MSNSEHRRLFLEAGEWVQVKSERPFPSLVSGSWAKVTHTWANILSPKPVHPRRGMKNTREKNGPTRSQDEGNSQWRGGIWRFLREQRGLKRKTRDKASGPLRRGRLSFSLANPSSPTAGSREVGLGAITDIHTNGLSMESCQNQPP